MSLCRYLPYRITLNAPLLLTSLEGDANSAVTSQFITGSSLRGVVARVLGNPDADATLAAAFQEFVLGDDVRYLNGYLVCQDLRTAPAPIGLRLPKGGELPTDAYDLSHFGGGTWPPNLAKRSAAQWLTTQVEPKSVEPRVSAMVHHQRDREKGRPDEHTGAIFSYESLDPGQTFAGLVQIFGADEDDVADRAKRLKELIPSRLLLGRSRRAGYGGDAEIAFDTLTTREFALGGLSGPVTVGTRIGVVLTSDYLGRDPWTGATDPEHLLEELPALVERVSSARPTIDRGRLRWQFRAVGGYNRRWGVPLPQGLAAQAGSVLILELTGDLDAAEILEIEAEGLGERRNEGFGRFRMVPEPGPTVRIARPPTVMPTEPVGTVPPFVIELQQRVLEELLLTRIANEAGRLVQSARALPSNSLLGKLRIPFRESPEAALALLRVWLGADESALKSPARNQLRACRLAGKSLHQWLDEMSAENSTDSGLALADIAQAGWVHSRASAETTLSGSSLSIRARLVDALLAEMMRRNRREGRG